MRRGRDDDVPDGPKRFHQVIHLWVMAWCGPLPTVGHMTVQADQGEDGEELVMPVSDWTGQLARERVAQLHRQAKRQRLVRLARAERRGGTSGVGRGPDTIRRPCRSLSAHALGQVALQQGGVPRQRLAQGPGRHVLGHAVQPLGEQPKGRVVHELRPDRGQALAGLASQHHRVGHQELPSDTLLLSGSSTSHPSGSGTGASKAPLTVMALLTTKRPIRWPPRRSAGWRSPAGAATTPRRRTYRAGSHVTPVGCTRRRL